MKMLKASLAIGLAIGCLWWVSLGIDWNQCWQLIRNAQGMWITVAVVCMMVSLAVRSIRWHRVFLWVAPEATPMDTLRPLYVGYLFNNMLPGKLGEIAKLVLISRFTGVKAVKSTVAIAMDRVVDGLGLAIVMGVALVMTPSTPPVIMGAWMAGFGLFGGVAIMAAVVSRSHRLTTVLVRLSYRYPALSKFADLESGRTEWVKMQTVPRMLTILGLSILNWITEGGVFWAVQHALALPGSEWMGILVMGVVSFGGILLSTPGGVGAHEYLVTVAFGPLGVPASPAFAVALITHLILLIPAALMGLVSVITIGWTSVTQTIHSVDSASHDR